MGRRVYTDKQLARARELWRLGHKQGVICRVMGITPVQFGVIRKTAKLPYRLPKNGRRKGILMVHTPAVVQQASALWHQGLSVSEIGQRLGIGKNRVSGLSGRNRDLFPPRPSPLKPRSA